MRLAANFGTAFSGDQFILNCFSSDRFRWVRGGTTREERGQSGSGTARPFPLGFLPRTPFFLTPFPCSLRFVYMLYTVQIKSVKADNTNLMERREER